MSLHDNQERESWDRVFPLNRELGILPAWAARYELYVIEWSARRVSMTEVVPFFTFCMA